MFRRVVAQATKRVVATSAVTRSLVSVVPRTSRNVQSTKIAYTAQRCMSNNLAQVLQSEIEHEEGAEEEVDQDYVDLKKEIEKTFAVEDVKGNGTVKLVSKANASGEVVTVTFDCQDLADDYMGDFDEEEEINADEIEPGINFEVEIAKNGKKLVAQCVGGNQGLTIRNIRHLAAADKNDDLDVYGGPNFDELDEALQEEIFQYLEDRRINESLSQFVYVYAGNKEQKEYVNWLHNLNDFVRK
jgi:complement component 1 Q subcomponent-binding protein